MAFRFGVSCGTDCDCGGVSCVLFTDNFDRADEDDVTNWTEVAGDWEVEGNILKLKD